MRHDAYAPRALRPRPPGDVAQRQADCAAFDRMSAARALTPPPTRFGERVTTAGAREAAKLARVVGGSSRSLSTGDDEPERCALSVVAVV